MIFDWVSAHDSYGLRLRGTFLNEQTKHAFVMPVACFLMVHLTVELICRLVCPHEVRYGQVAHDHLLELFKLISRKLTGPIEQCVIERTRANLELVTYGTIIDVYRV